MLILLVALPAVLFLVSLVLLMMLLRRLESHHAETYAEVSAIRAKAHHLLSG